MSQPVTGRIRLARNRAAAEAYPANVGNGAFHQEWWDARPELHPVLAAE
ncbi:hypothetical protein [Streptomyces sp. CC208A]|nr:hypothetical protein [Streptomyces sp. CC208A]